LAVSFVCGIIKHPLPIAECDEELIIFGEMEGTGKEVAVANFVALSYQDRRKYEASVGIAFSQVKIRTE
jgi:hypothetical protein